MKIGINEAKIISKVIFGLTAGGIGAIMLALSWNFTHGAVSTIPLDGAYFIGSILGAMAYNS